MQESKATTTTRKPELFPVPEVEDEEEEEEEQEEEEERVSESLGSEILRKNNQQSERTAARNW